MMYFGRTAHGTGSPTQWVKNHEFCVNEDFRVKNEDFCIENDEFCRPLAAQRKLWQSGA